MQEPPLVLKLRFVAWWHLFWSWRLPEPAWQCERQSPLPAPAADDHHRV